MRFSGAGIVTSVGAVAIPGDKRVGLAIHWKERSMPQRPPFPPPPVAPARVPAAHVQAASTRIAQAKIQETPRPATRPASPSPSPAASQKTIPRASPVRLKFAIQRASSSSSSATTTGPAAAAAVPPPPPAIEMRGAWNRNNYTDHLTGAALFSDTAAVNIYGQAYTLVVKSSAQKHDHLTSAAAVVAELNARSGDFSHAFDNSTGIVRLASGNPLYSILFRVDHVTRRLEVFHAQRTAGPRLFSSGKADESKSWRKS